MISGLVDQKGIIMVPLVAYLIRTHSRDWSPSCHQYITRNFSWDQHVWYRERSHRRRIGRMGLVICRMFSFWLTTPHLKIIPISSYLPLQWSVSWITRSTARSWLEHLSRLTSSWGQLNLFAWTMFHTPMCAVGGAFHLMRGGSAGTCLRYKCSHSYDVGKGYISNASCYTSTWRGITLQVDGTYSIWT